MFLKVKGISGAGAHTAVDLHRSEYYTRILLCPHKAHIPSNVLWAVAGCLDSRISE
jgi:hypothetical protein